MQGPETMQAANAKASVPPAALPREEEHSGLIEIKELATTAKQRIRRRRTSDHDVQEQLFATASGLHAVALPEPGKEKPPELAVDTTEVPAVSPAIAAPVSEPKKKRSPALAVGMISALALCAAAATFVYFGGLKYFEGEVAAGGGAAEADSTKLESPAPAPASAASEAAPEAAPQVTSLAGSGAEGGEGEVAGEPGGIVPETEDEEAEAPAEVAPAARAERPDESARERRRAERAEAKADKKDRVAKKAAPEPEKPAATKATEAAGAAAFSADTGDDSIDDILSDVTGGVKEDDASAEKTEKPTKKSLDRSDISRAMRPVSGRAGKCHDKEGATGTVSVRFTVQPNGKLVGVSATGKYKGTATGKCVAAAVKSASFPAFSGRPMTFTFPFLLAQ